jgi:hypothetical protein
MYLWTQHWIDSAEKWHWAVQVYQLTYCQRTRVKNPLFLGNWVCQKYRDTAAWLTDLKLLNEVYMNTSLLYIWDHLMHNFFMFHICINKVHELIISCSNHPISKDSQLTLIFES